MKLLSLSFRERVKLYILDPIRFAIEPLALDVPDRMEMTEEEFEEIDSLLPIRQAITGCLITLKYGPWWLKDDAHASLNSYLSVLMTMTYNDGLNLLARKKPFDDDFWWMVEIGSVTPEQPEEVDDYILRESVEIAAERYPSNMPFRMRVFWDNKKIYLNSKSVAASTTFSKMYWAVQKKMADARKQQYEGDELWNKLYEEEEKVLNAWKEALLALK